MEGGQTERMNLELQSQVNQLREMIEAQSFQFENTQVELSNTRKQNLILKQLNSFHQSSEDQEDKLLFAHNFELKQEIIKYQNIIEGLEEQIKQLKEAKRGQVQIVEQRVFEPSKDLLKMLNQDKFGEQAIKENKELRA